MSKGVSPFISYSLVILLAVSSLAIIMFVAVPTLDRIRDSGVINEAQANLQKMDAIIREVASEAAGSIRKTGIGVRGGQYRVDNSSGQLIFTFDTKSGIVPFGVNTKQGNILISGGGLVTASANATDLVLDNGVLLLDFPNVTSAGYNQEKPTLIRNKLNSANINLVNFSVTIGGQPFLITSSGIVQTGIVPRGTVYFTGTSSGSRYTLLYTLLSGADWFQVQLKNLSSTTNASIVYNFSLGTSATNDVINIANQTAGSVSPFTTSLMLALNQTNTSVYIHGGNGAIGYLASSVNFTNSTIGNATVTGYAYAPSTNVVNYTVMLDSDNSTSVNSSLNISGLSGIGVYYNASDGTWRNVSELGSIGQGYWNLTGTWLNYTLGGGDGYDYGIRDALAGGSYWLDENGRSLGTGLVGYWKFGEGSGFSYANDSSGNINTGILTNMNTTGNASSGWTIAGKYGSALLFDGVNDLVSITDPGTSSLDLSGSMTLSGWFKFNALTSVGLITKRNAGGSQLNYILRWLTSVSPSGGLIFNIRNTSGTNQEWATSWVPATNTWYLVTVTYDDSSKNGAFYINGTNIGTFTAVGSPATDNQPVRIGNDDGNTLFFNGTIDEVRIYDRALSSEEIKRLYESTVINLKSDFVSVRTEPYLQFNLTNSTGQTIFQQAAESMRLDNSPLTTNYPVNASMTYFFDWKENDWKVWQKNNYLDALVGWWKLDEGQGTNAADGSGKGSMGTLNNGPIWITNSSCKFGSCLSFDGSDDFIQVQDSLSLNISKDVSVSAWVKPREVDASRSQGIVIRLSSYFLFISSNNEIAFQNGAAGGCSKIFPGLQANRWYHITGTYNINGICSIYVDGSLFHSASTAWGASTNTNPTYIGDNPYTPGSKFNGTLDDVRIWNRALTAEEINAEYQNTKRGMPDWTDPRFKHQFKWMQQFKGGNNPEVNVTYMMTAADPFVRIFVDTGPTGYSKIDNRTMGAWQFNEGSGATTRDESMYKNDASWTNAANNATWITNSSCKIGNCLYFDGSDDYISAGNPSTLNLTGRSTITVGGWVYYGDTSQARREATVYRGNPSISGISYVLNRVGAANGGIRFGLNVSGTFQQISSSESTQSNRWYHAVGTFDGATVKLYVNGVLKASTSASGIISEPTGANQITMGIDYGGEYLKGYIDEVKIWDKALAADEIVEEYQRGLQHNMTIPISLGQSKRYFSTRYIDNENAPGAGWSTWDVQSYPCMLHNSTDEYFTTSSTAACDSNALNRARTMPEPIWAFNDHTANDNSLFAVSGWLVGSTKYGGHGDFTIRTENISAVGKYDRQTYIYNFNATKNNKFLLALGHTGTIGDTSLGNPSSWAIGFSNETLASVANSTLTYYNLQDNRLVGWWKFNDGAGSVNASDSSGFGNNGRLVNMNATGLNASSGWNTSCKFGSCLNFDGENDYVNAGNASGLDIVDSITLSAWIRVPETKTDTYQVIMSRFVEDPQFTYKGYSLYVGKTIYSGHLFADLGCGASSCVKGIQGNTNVADDQWHHVALTYDGTTIKIYVDGKVDVSSVWGKKISTAADVLIIGAFNKNYGSSNPSNYMDGLIDNAKIYSRALSPQEILADYRATADDYPNWNKVNSTDGYNAEHVVTPHFNYDGGAVGIWSFDEGSGITVVDSSGNENEGILGNSSVTPIPTWMTNSSCKFGGCLHFNGSQFLNVSDSTSLRPTDKITIEAWVKTSNPTGNQVIITKRYSPTSNPWNSYILDISGSSEKYRLCLSTGVGGSQICLTSVTSTTTDWVFVTGIFDGTSMKMYINGILESVSTSFSGNSIGYSSESLHIGWYTGWGFNGTLDEVRVYPKALTDYDVWEHYSKGVSKYYDDFATTSSGQTYRYYGVEDSDTNLQPITPKDTVLHLRFNDNSTVNVTDFSGYGNNGRSMGGVNWATNSSCKTSFGGCMIFDGTNDQVTIPYSSSLNTTNALTVSAWVKYDSVGAQSNVIVDKRPADNSKGWSLSTNAVTGGRGFYLQLLSPSCGGNPGPADQNVILTDKWYHVVGTYDGSNIRVYVNGTLGATASCSGTINIDSSDVWIANNEANPTQFTDGTIDEVLIINRSLSADEIYQLYLGGYNRHTGDLVGWWKFNENNGDNTLDGSGNGNTGTINGVSQAWNSGWNSTDCRIGGCLKFDGSDDYVSVNDDSNLDITNEITLESWIYPVKGTDRYVVTKDNDQYTLYIDGSNTISSYLTTTSGSACDSDIAPTLNTWQHVSLTYDGSNMRIYIDGNLKNTCPKSGAISTSNNPLRIGSFQGTTNFFNGTIDNVKIFKRALTADEVLSEYQQSHDQYSIYNYQHRVASADGISTITYNLTDKDFPSQQGYDQRMLLINGTYTQNISINVTGTICSSSPARLYATDYDSTEYNPSLVSGLIYAGPASRFIRICAYNSGTANTLNLTSLGETSVIIPFTQGTNATISNLMHQVERDGILSGSFAQTLAAAGTVTVSMMLEYQNIALVGTMRIGTGTYDICIKKTGIAAGRPVVSLSIC